MKDYCVMPEGCLGCRHFAGLKKRKGRVFNPREGYCQQVDDGYSNDCRLE